MPSPLALLILKKKAQTFEATTNQLLCFLEKKNATWVHITSPNFLCVDEQAIFSAMLVPTQFRLQVLANSDTIPSIPMIYLQKMWPLRHPSMPLHLKYDKIMSSIQNSNCFFSHESLKKISHEAEASINQSNWVVLAFFLI
jgi:hypothetical protein